MDVGRITSEISIRPEKSHVFVVSLGFFSFLFGCIGLLFLWEEKPNAWVPFLVMTVFLVASIVVWKLSHKDLDLGGSLPTIISSDKNGVQISTDTRALNFSTAIKHLETLVSIVAHRKPLPEPDGILRENGDVIPGSKSAAVQYIAEVNEKELDLARQATELLCGGARKAEVLLSETKSLDRHPLSEVEANRNAAILTE